MIGWLRQPVLAPRLDFAAVALGLILSVALLFLGLGLAAVIVTRWPPDHFRRHPGGEGAERPRLLRRVVRNVVGLVLLACGVVLAIPGVPGPGFLVIFAALSLIDFPGRLRLLRRLVRLPPLRATIDSLRRRYGKPPLDLDEGGDGESATAAT